MNKFSVIVLKDAERDMETAHAWLLPQTEQHAPEWYNGLINAIISLENMPGRWGIAPESAEAGEEIRQLLYGHRQYAYRVLFTI